MSFFDTFSEMLVVFFTIAMGVLSNRLGYLNEEINRKLTKVVLNITMPSMILASVMVGDALPEIGTTLSVLKVAVVFYGMEALFLLVLPRFLGGSPKQKGVWRYACMFPNMAFIGYPVVEALFGAGAIFYGVILVMPFNILTYSIGPTMLGGHRRFNWKSLCTPVMITSVISLVLALTGTRTPVLLGNMLDFVGDLTVPVSLLILGSVLAGMKVKQVFAMPRLWILVAFRLLVMPVVLLALLRLMSLDAVVLGVAVIEMAMPVAVNGAMLCMEYDGDIECMAQVIFLTTLFSIVTIPLIAMLL